VRLFSAIEIDPRVREDLVGIQKRLSPVAGVRWSPAQNLHLTLRFYGEWPNERLPELAASLDGLDQTLSVRVDLQKLGFLPNEREPRALVALVAPSNALSALQDELEAAAQDLEFKREPRTYRPHITLARIREPGQARRLVETARSQNWSLPEFEAHRFALYASETTTAGSIYRKLREFPLRRVA